MMIKKTGGKVTGAHLTVAERTAMNIEIKKELAEYDRKHMMEIDAVVLWQLHVQLGFGKKRLERFYRKFSPEFSALIARYDMEDSDGIWLCTHQLKEIGVNMDELVTSILGEKSHPIMEDYIKKENGK